MNLKREIKKEELENRFGNIPVPRQVNAITIDTTITPEQHIEEMLKKRLTWGKDRYTECNAEVERRATIIEQRQETARQAKQKEAEAIRAASDTPVNRFVHALQLRNHSLLHLDEWLVKETAEQKNAAFEEYKLLASRRGLALSQEDIAFGLSFLYANVKTETSPSLLSKIKTSLGAS